MSSVSSTIVPLWELAHGQAAECFAVLVKRERLLKKDGDPYFKCHFRAKHEVRPAMIWSNHALFGEAELWQVGIPYRLAVIGEKTTFGPQVKLLKIAPAGPDDAVDGYNYADLVESSDFQVDWLYLGVVDAIKKYVDDPHLRQLLKLIFRQHAEQFKRMPAAERMHHAYNAGLLEHVWSLTRLCGFFADHYADYYRSLNPPLDKGLLITAAILHDIGKLWELQSDDFETSYTLPGRLIGHIVMGRDLVRDTARQIDGFHAETLMRLEHAILAHHGRREFGAPVLPQTIEALLLSMADDIDAKVHAVARELQKPSDDEPFTNRIYSLDNRRFYKGIPLPELDPFEPPAEGLLDGPPPEDG